jgi:hypothetical protein
LKQGKFVSIGSWNKPTCIPLSPKNYENNRAI